MRLPRKKSGFLLIEHLIALVIISISLVAFMGLSTAFLKIKDRLNVPDDVKWHVAVQQMNFNYAGFRLTSFNGYDPYTAHFTNTVSEKTEVITLVSSWKDGGNISLWHSFAIYQKKREQVTDFDNAHPRKYFSLKFCTEKSSHLCQSERSKGKEK